MKHELDALIARLETCPPTERIELREAILAFGADAIEALARAARRVPALVASVAAWLEVLAKRDPSLTSPTVRALRGLVALDGSAAVQGPLERVAVGNGNPRRTPATKSPRRTAAETEVYARAIKAAREGRIIVYGDLESNRGHVGRYLSNIAHAEADLGRPPLTAIVVSKSTGLPGDGFIEAMVEVGYAHRGEKLEPVWKRAVRDVHAYWHDRPAEGVPVFLPAPAVARTDARHVSARRSGVLDDVSASGQPPEQGLCQFLALAGKPCQNPGRYWRDGRWSCSRKHDDDGIA